MDEKEIIEEVEKKVREELKGKIEPDMLGYIHIFEERKKELLKEYGISFKTMREHYRDRNID